MKRFVGFRSMSGQITSKDTGEVVDWSNRLIRCVTDENLLDGEYGLNLVEQKLKKSQVCKSLGLFENSTEAAVDEALKRILNRKIEFKLGVVKGSFVVDGFTVIGEVIK